MENNFFMTFENRRASKYRTYCVEWSTICYRISYVYSVVYLVCIQYVTVCVAEWRIVYIIYICPNKYPGQLISLISFRPAGIRYVAYILLSLIAYRDIFSITAVTAVTFHLKTV